jgi:hypothetical protein
MLTTILAVLIPLFSFSPPLVGNLISFSPVALSNSFVIDSEPVTSIFPSTATVSLPLIPGVLRLHAALQISSVVKGYTGICVGDTVRVICNGIQANNFAAMYDRALPNGATANDAFPGFVTIPSAVNLAYEVDMLLSASTTDTVFVTGDVGNIADGSASVADVNLLGPITFYACGALSGDVVQAAWNPFLF